MSVEKIQEQAQALFEYIRGVCLIDKKTVLDVGQQQGQITLRSLDDPSCVTLFSRDTMEGEEAPAGGTLLSFRKPEFTHCPAPAEALERWLAPGWQDYRREAVCLERLELRTEGGQEAEDQRKPAEEADAAETQYEYFADDPARSALFEAWAHKRAVWVKHEEHTARLRDLFTDLYDMYNQYRQSPDALEIVIGNGLLTDRQNGEIRHPLFLKRAELTLDPVNNTLTLSDAEKPAQMYLPLFSAMEGINDDVIHSLEKTAEDEGIHPWDHHEGADFLKSVAHQLHASSLYLDEGEEAVRTDERITVRWEPYIILRSRPDGTISALESILGDLAKGAEIPTSLRGVLGDFSRDAQGSDEESDAEYGASEGAQLPLEDEDILLPKPANREQMDIVRRIERAPEVLVQGPPGTGKTHTIANLLGHFLAKGQTVLVTSHTSKALKVLKEKVPKQIQALCVAVFGDQHEDMEESVRAIIEHTSCCGLVEQEAQAEAIRAERHRTLLALQEARKRVYAIRHREFEPIVYCGESWSPSRAAEYVSAQEALTALIPGEIAREAAFPLAQEELEWLYASSGLLTPQAEAELADGLPDAEKLMTPQQLADGMELLERLNLQLQAINAGGRVNLAWKANRRAVVDQLTDQVYVGCGDPAAEAALRDMLSVYEESIPGWAVFAMSDGAEDALPRRRWEQLLTLIDETYTKAQTVLEKQLTRPIQVAASSPEALAAPYGELCEDAKKYGRVKKTLFMSREKKNALDAVTIAGKAPETLDDVRDVLAYLELLSLRGRLAPLWDSLTAAHGSRRFAELGEEPERVCYQQRKIIEFWLGWVNHHRKALCEQAEAAGIGASLLQPISGFVSFTDEKAAYMLNDLREQLVPAVNLLHLVNELHSFACAQESTLKLLEAYPGSAICANLTRALEEGQAEQYERAMNALRSVRGDAEIRARRTELLDRLALSAPGWADAVRRREGIHGETSVPESLQTAWKVRQLSMAVDEITSASLSEAEKQVTACVERFRSETEKLAAVLAWCALQRRIERHPEMRQALTGWKQTMAKIGKGTGKRAPALRAEARKLMIECQKAVPAWIMPVSNVMSSVDPASTRFDVIIIDEASQSDITAAAILYMGKKVIVVGDDEQVSPAPVGRDEAKMQQLMDMHIRDRIPNYHLWDARTSLYEIVEQATSNHLMLREHFRCVPDIIGYSNWLSYKGQIRPLREAGSSPFKTAVVPFRVNGMRKGHSKINEEEAEAIVALMRACLERPEYADKTFGVIIMLGDEQAKLITRKLADSIPITELEKHDILCGTPSGFQGDERDVIFLSMVDSNGSDGPLALASGEGQGANGKPMRQRYNVAVSRAKDQLWIVHSLDRSADLKPGDLRRGLLEYASNPHSYAIQSDRIDEAADSPFEAEVAKALAARGYHIVQQWPVGAYRIDMVAVCGEQRVAIECDGERWHSGEEKIREDMERQAILERLGWRFIRVRGSEYYRRPDQAISRVVSELNAAGIFPEESTAEAAAACEDALIASIRERAAQLIQANKQPELPQATAEESMPEDETAPDPVPNPVPNPVPEAAPDPAGSAAQSAPAAPPQRVARNKKPKHKPEQPEQLSLFPPDGDPLTELREAGFTCIDNRERSGILWVLYDGDRAEAFHEIERRYMLKASIERRGAVSTNYAPAWRIQMKR